MPSVPLAHRSSRICRCVAELPSCVMRKSTSTSPSSVAAALQPARANDQKFAALFETNASFSFLLDGAAGEPGFSADSFLPQPEASATTHTAVRSNGVGFIISLWVDLVDYSTENL